MRRLTAYLLCFCFAVAGAGALRHLHELAHGQAALATADDEQAPSRDSRPSPTDHDRSCPLHIMLSAPLLAQASSTLIIWDGAVQWAFLAGATDLPGGRMPARVDCRGPPLC